MFQYSHACQHNKKIPSHFLFHRDTDKLRIYGDISRQPGEFSKDGAKRTRLHSQKQLKLLKPQLDEGINTLSTVTDLHWDAFKG